MSYSKRNIKDINVSYSCPSCDYETIYKHYFIKHLKKCEELDEYDDYESYYIDENFTLADYIEEQSTFNQIIKQFIKSNELEKFKDKTFDEIFLYIKNKFPYNIQNNKNGIDFDVSFIYEFFFGETKESREKMFKNIKKILEERKQ
jgi:hypothetical protein